VGRGLGNGLRAELEGLYTYNEFQGTNYGSHEQKYGPMVNVLYDFVGVVPVVEPYIGVGVGYLWAQEDNVHGGVGPVSVTAGNSTQGSFAYQGIVGLAVPFATPGLALTADYRFLGLAENRDYGGSVTVGRTSLPATFRGTNDYNNIITIGFRYNFGVAPPAPPAPAAIAPSPVTRSYLVFFDWDKAALTDRARQIVAEAAANSTKVQYTRLEVNGYTDTSGTPRYNQGLSVRRARAVAAELIKDGVPKGAITIQGFGETRSAGPNRPGRSRAAEPPRRNHHRVDSGSVTGSRTPSGALFLHRRRSETGGHGSDEHIAPVILGGCQ
jgi:OmpA-OmpF porin, OOP family